MRVEGCEEAKADWKQGRAWAKYDPGKTNPEELVKAIHENTTFEAKVLETGKKEKEGTAQRTRGARRMSS